MFARGPFVFGLLNSAVALKREIHHLRFLLIWSRTTGSSVSTCTDWESEMPVRLRICAERMSSRSFELDDALPDARQRQLRRA